MPRSMFPCEWGPDIWRPSEVRHGLAPDHLRDLGDHRVRDDLVHELLPRDLGVPLREPAGLLRWPLRPRTGRHASFSFAGMRCAVGVQ